MSMSAYDTIGRAYSAWRRADPRIAGAVHRALGKARTVLDVGAGTGSYEPDDRLVVAVEPSQVMVVQRPAGSAPAVLGSVEALPTADGGFEAVMTVLTAHHWNDRVQGFAEMRRVAPRRVVLAYDIQLHNSLWLLADYLPTVAEFEARRCPSIQEIADGIEADRIETIPIAHDCLDGMTTAYWRRPEAYLDPTVRSCCSCLAQSDPIVVEAAIARLAEDLRSGRWQDRYGYLLDTEERDYGYRLLVSN